MLKNTERDPHQNKPDTHVIGSYPSFVANKVNTITGWYGMDVYGYGNPKQLENWWRFAEKFDAVIHQLPVPKPDAKGNWRKIYNIETPQIAIAHDAHFREAYPHMIDIAPKLRAVSVTNPAGYVALEHYPGLRCFIGAPHRIRNWEKQKAWKKRRKRFVSAHVWKAWKHMDIVLRALPHIHDEYDNFIGGDGIEARYMRSVDKCKEKYEGLWKQALRKGRMNYAGLISPKDLMHEYENSRLMVDMSYSKKFAELGNHFNRSTIEAYNGGCVPLVVYENMKDDTGIFKSGKHYIAIPWEFASERNLADRIMAALEMRSSVAEEIIFNGRNLLMNDFNYIVSANEFVRLAEGRERVGIYKKLERGTATKEIKRARTKLLESL